MAHSGVVCQRLLRLREVHPAPEAPAGGTAARVSVAPQRERWWRSGIVLSAARAAELYISVQFNICGGRGLHTAHCSVESSASPRVKWRLSWSSSSCCPLGCRCLQ